MEDVRAVSSLAQNWAIDRLIDGLEEFDIKELDGMSGLVALFGRFGDEECKCSTNLQLALLKATGLDRGAVFAPHPAVYEMFADAVHPAFIHHSFSEKYFSDYLAYQADNRLPTYWLLDSITSDRHSMVSPSIKRLLSESKQHNLLVLLQCQHLFDIYGGSTRDIVDLWFISVLTDRYKPEAVAHMLRNVVDASTINDAFCRAKESKSAYLVVSGLKNNKLKFRTFTPSIKLDTLPRYWATGQDAYKAAELAFDPHRFLQQLSTPNTNTNTNTNTIIITTPTQTSASASTSAATAQQISPQWKILMNPLSIKSLGL
jgi:hypothetical protein